jgi:hypothetical protein
MAQKKKPPNKNRSIFNKTAGLPERSPGVLENEADQTLEDIGTHSLKEDQSSRTVKDQISAGDDSSVATDSADELTSPSNGGTASSTVSQSSKLNAAGAKSGVSSAVHSSGHSVPTQAAVAVSASLSEVKSQTSTESQEKPLGTTLRSFTSATSENAVAGNSSTAASTAGSSVSTEKVSVLQQSPSNVETTVSKAKADTATTSFFYSMEPTTALAGSTRFSSETQTTFGDVTKTSTALKTTALANANETTTTAEPPSTTSTSTSTTSTSTSTTSTSTSTTSTSTSTTSSSTSTTTTTTTTTPTIATKGYTTVTTKIPKVKIVNVKK